MICAAASRRLIYNRRVKERRVVPYAFGSDEWVENIKINYYVWPKFERRQSNRRSEDRRAFDRRHKQLIERQQTERKSAGTLLTHEELKLIEELYKVDLD